MADIAIARPFTLVDATGQRWEVGIAVYTNMSQEFCDDPYIAAHSEAAVLARGGTLLQTRDILGRDPATGAYVSQGARHSIFLNPSINPEYTQTIEPQWPPLFVSDVDRLDLERPPSPKPPRDPPWLRGWRVDDLEARDHKPFVHEATRLFPGDPSPPISRSTTIDRSGEQVNLRWTTTAAPPLYPALTASPEPVMNPWPQQRFSGTQATPTPAAWPQDQYTWRDPRG